MEVPVGEHRSFKFFQKSTVEKYAKEYGWTLMALHPNFDTRDDCSKRVQLVGANRAHRVMKKMISWLGKNRGMHPHRVQLLQAEVSEHPHRVQMHPALVHFGIFVHQIPEGTVLRS